MSFSTPHDSSSHALARAHRLLIVRRLPLFTVFWLATAAAWSAVLVGESLVGAGPALLWVGWHAGVLALALSACRADPQAPRALSIVTAAVVVLGLSAIAEFVAVTGNADMLAFVLLTLYLASSLFFAWGWRPALIVWTVTVAVWLGAGPFLKFFLPPLELWFAIAIGSSVCLAVAEVSARGFATVFRRGLREREAVLALAASRDAYRDLTENANDLIYTHDLGGRFTYVNPAFARYAGVPAATLIGRRSEELVDDHPERPDIPSVIARLAAGETVPPQVLPVRAPDGLRWLECVVSGIRGADGGVVGVRGIARDVTERRHAEEALRASLDELRRSEENLRLLAQQQTMIREEERKRLGFDLHDDVCQELAGIGILVESVRRQVNASLPAAAATLERVARYLNEVLEHLRLLAGDLQPLLLRDLGLEGSLRSLAAGMSSASTRVTAEFPTAIPRLENDAEIGVYRIAQEALANAVRHAGAPTIVLTLAVADATLRLDVCDDGCGFVCDEPQRVSRLGLASMQQRALALGGRLEVHSEVGRGTVVRLQCPLAARARASAA